MESQKKTLPETNGLHLRWLEDDAEDRPIYSGATEIPFPTTCDGAKTLSNNGNFPYQPYASFRQCIYNCFTIIQMHRSPTLLDDLPSFGWWKNGGHGEMLL